MQERISWWQTTKRPLYRICAFRYGNMLISTWSNDSDKLKIHTYVVCWIVYSSTQSKFENIVIHNCKSNKYDDIYAMGWERFSNKHLQMLVLVCQSIRKSNIKVCKMFVCKIG